MSENSFFVAPLPQSVREAQLLLAKAEASSDYTPDARIKAVRNVLKAFETEGRELNHIEVRGLIGAISRQRGVTGELDLTKAIQADLAVQRMGRQRLDDIFDRKDVSIFDPRDLVATKGGVPGLSDLKSTADALALQRGRFQEVSAPLAARIYVTVHAGRLEHHERGVPQPSQAKRTGVLAQGLADMTRRAAQGMSRSFSDFTVGKGPSASEQNLAFAVNMRSERGR